MSSANHIFSLDKSSRKYECPNCRQKTFVLYLQHGKGEKLADKAGRCDREQRCGYHLTPKQFFAENPGAWLILPNTKVITIDKNKAGMPIDYLPIQFLEKSVLRHQRSNLYPFLETLFRDDLASLLCQEYFVGANKDGNTVFWQVNKNGNICQAKIIQYNSATGRRNKETGVLFAGKAILNNLDANLQQCFFGEYLLSFPENDNKPIAIVESEKTAIIASVYFSDFVWLATGGKHGCKWTMNSVCKVLKGRKVILFPDLGAFDAWKVKGELMAVVASCKVSVSDILEKAATPEERAEGLDIADFLLRKKDNSGLALTDDNYPVFWDYTEMNPGHRQYFVDKAKQEFLKYNPEEYAA